MEKHKNAPEIRFEGFTVDWEQCELDVFHWDAERGSYILLCSDGLSNLLDDQEILFEVVHGLNKRRCCQRLLEIAKGRGAPDNVTMILVLI